MGTAPMLPLILSMSIPSMFSMIIQALYNIVDSIYLSRYDETALTALSLALPVQMLIISIAVGTGIGINSLISRRLGEKNFEQANSAATHAIFLGILSWLVTAVLALIFLNAYFSIFTENPKLLGMSREYTYIVTLFSIGIFLQVNIEKTLQATGNMLYPMYFQLTGAISNIILDPFFIFGIGPFPKLGVSGAAIATVIGQIIALLFAVYVLLFKNHEVKIDLKRFKPDLQIIRSIYAVGFPSILMQSIGSVMITCFNRILVGFSETAVAVLGIYFRLQSFIFMGYSYGARNRERLISALKTGCVFAFLIMLLGSLLFIIFPHKLLGIFEADAALLEIGVPALRIISTCFTSAAIGIMFSTVFQAIGQGSRSLIISLLRQLILLLPAAYLLSKLGLFYVWFALPISEAGSLVISVLMFISVYRGYLKPLKPLNE
jgi:putative MATE family efflux protein